MKNMNVTKLNPCGMGNLLKSGQGDFKIIQWVNLATFELFKL